MTCCGFNQTTYGIDRKNRELGYWRQRLHDALTHTRAVRFPYPALDELREAYRTVDLFWMGEDRTEAAWQDVCQLAYRHVTAFEKWVVRR